MFLEGFLDCAFKDVKELLKSYKVTDVEDAVFESKAYKPSIIVANKIEVEGAEASLKLLEAYVDGQLPIIAVSCKTRQDVEKIGETLFKTLDLIRVYTKEPSEKDFSKKPFVLKRVQRFTIWRRASIATSARISLMHGFGLIV